jgi:single-strand DNA-binding protein
MNTLRNKVSLIGRLGQNPEMQNVGKEFKLAKFSLATNENYKDKNGKWVDNTQWHNLKAWGKTAERIVQYGSKGQEIMIEGRIVNGSYEKGGEKRYTTDVEVTDFLILTPMHPEKASETNEQ